MPSTGRWILAAGAVLALVATGLGAYASHGLASRLGAGELATVELAIQYQFFASLGLIAIGLLADRYPHTRTPPLAALALGAGVVLFCGGIYATALGAPEAFARVTPIGGLALMAGWGLVAVAAWRAGRSR